MPEKSGQFFTSFIVFMLWLAGPLGWFYYIWITFQLQIFGWFVAGILFPPLGSLLGIWSFLFGVPGFMWS